MSTQIKCDKCGRHNEVNRLFCVGCGAKLNFSGVRLQKQGVPASRIIARMVRLVVFLGLLALLGLLVWPTAPVGQVGTQQDADVLFEKMRGLNRALQTGTATRERILEREVNAYLAELLLRTAAPEGGLQTESIRVEISEDQVTVHVGASISFLKLSYEVEGRPEVGERGFRLDLTRAQMGRVPMPGPLHDRVAQRVLDVFRNLDDEKAILDNLDYLAAVSRELRVATH